MQTQDSIGVTGGLDIKLFDERGVLKVHQRTHNTVTAVGKAYIADRLGLQAQALMSNMAVGTGTPSSTALGTEVSRGVFQSQTSSGATWTYVGSWDIEDNFSATLTEAGVFNADSRLGGTMLCSASFAGIVKAVNDSLVITWVITIS